jgi:DNA-binding SARP family transcriptional activator
MKTLRIHLLGEFSISRDETPITAITGGKVLSLLAYLLLNRSRQSRKHISYLFWPDSDEGQAMTNLRKLFLLLRRSLPDSEDYLKADSLSLQWNEHASTYLDVLEFEKLAQGPSIHQLKEAITLYKGPLMPGFYDDWVDSERERLAQLYQNALENLLGKLELNRRYHEALPYAKLLLRLDPLREERYQALMRLHALSGDLNGAVKTYQDCETILKNELDVSPSEETKQTLESLRRGTATVQSGSEKELHLFVGRDHEWKTLLSAWLKARSGKPQLVLVSGEPGIGKTRLAEEFRDWTQKQGVQTSFAKCYATEGGLAYAPIVNWLNSIDLPDLQPIWLSELTRFIPELSARYPALPAPLPLKENWQRIKLFEALRRALVGSRPSGYILDDIQWCDEASVHWLHDLFENDAAYPTMIVATVRSGDEPAALQDLLAALRSTKQVTEIMLSPLDRLETQAVAEGVLQDTFPVHTLDRFYHETGGNPLFIIETLRTGRVKEGDMIPAESSTILHVISDRFSMLSEPLNRIIQIASVIGFPFPFTLMEKLAELNSHELLEHVEVLGKKSIFKHSDSFNLVFTHDKLREAAYQSLSIVRRQQYHRQIALAMETVFADQLDTYAGRIAFHFEHAGSPNQAIHYYQKSARKTVSLYANESSITDYQKILKLADDSKKSTIIYQMAKIYEVVGNRHEAHRLYCQVLDNHAVILSLKEKAHFKAALGNCLSLMSKFQEALEILKQAHTEFELVDDQAGLSNTLTIIGIVYYYLGQSSDALAAFSKRRKLHLRCVLKKRIVELLA